jgi:transcriptional regulator with XRE-family HTH domain
MNYTLLVLALVNKFGDQTALAKKIGVSQSTISNWIGGSDIIGHNRDVILGLARGAGIDLESDLQSDPKVVELLNVKKKPGFAAPDKAGGDAILTKEQCRAARGLVGRSQIELASDTGVGIGALRLFEVGKRFLSEANLREMRKSFEKAGVVFIDRGVRLR